MLISVEGLPKVGKTHFAEEFPEPGKVLHLDFAKTSMGFRQIKKMEGTGDAWFTVNKLKSGDQGYAYITEWSQVYEAIGNNEKNYKTVVIDDSFNARGLAALEKLNSINSDWLAREHWGHVTVMLKNFLEDCSTLFPYVLIVHQVHRDSEGKHYTRYYPSDVLYSCDVALAIEVDSNSVRKARIIENRFQDKTQMVREVENPDYWSLMAELGVPEEFWVV